MANNYLNKIKVLDASGKVSPGEEFGFGIGSLRVDESNGNIVYDGLDKEGNIQSKIFLAKEEKNGKVGYTLEGTVLKEYIDERDTFLKKVEYNSDNQAIVFTFRVGNGEIEDGVANDTDPHEEVISVPVKDFPIEADNIYFTLGDSIKLTEAFGRYQPSEQGYVDVPLIDQQGNKYSLQDFFKNAYQVVNNNPQVDPPVASIELYKNKSSIATSNIVAEVGSTPTVYFKVRYTDGNFQYAGNAGCAWNGGTTECQGKSITVAAEDLDSVKNLTAGKIQPGQNLVTLTYSYGSSTASATNNLGETIEQTIQEANDQNVTAAYYIQGNYYAYGGSSGEELTSNADIIKSLKSKSNSQASSFQVAITANTSHITIAIPSNRKITKIADSNAFEKDILNTFTIEKNTIRITFGYYSQDYTIYKYSTTTLLKQNTLTVYLANA